MIEKRAWLEIKRTKKRLTQYQVAQLANIDRAYYTQIENGNRRPSPEVAQRLAAILDFDWTIFFKQKSGVKPQKNKVG